MWHVKSHILEHILFYAFGKLAWPISAEVKKVGREGQTKMVAPSIRMSSYFVCLICAKFKLSVTAARRNKLSLLSEFESITLQDTILSIWASKTEVSAFELTWCKHPVKFHAGDCKHHDWYVDAVHLPQIQSQVVTTRGCKALQLVNTVEGGLTATCQGIGSDEVG